MSGIAFDLSALEHNRAATARVPLFLGLFLLTRGVPAVVLYRRVLARRQRSALAFLSATGLPLIVVITTIGVDEGKMRPENAATRAAGMLSVLIYPLLGLQRLGSKAAAPNLPSSTGAGEGGGPSGPGRSAKHPD